MLPRRRVAPSPARGIGRPAAPKGAARLIAAQGKSQERLEHQRCHLRQRRERHVLSEEPRRDPPEGLQELVPRLAGVAPAIACRPGRLGGVAGGEVSGDESALAGCRRSSVHPWRLIQCLHCVLCIPAGEIPVGYSLMLNALIILSMLITLLRCARRSRCSGFGGGRVPWQAPAPHTAAARRLPGFDPQALLGAPERGGRDT